MRTHDIQLELPNPREVTLRAPDIVFTAGLELNLGGVTYNAQLFRAGNGRKRENSRQSQGTLSATLEYPVTT